MRFTTEAIGESTMTELLQFLIVFDHQQGALHQEVAVFTDVADALRV